MRPAKLIKFIPGTQDYYHHVSPGPSTWRLATFPPPWLTAIRSRGFTIPFFHFPDGICNEAEQVEWAQSHPDLNTPRPTRSTSELDTPIEEDLAIQIWDGTAAAAGVGHYDPKEIWSEQRCAEHMIWRKNRRKRVLLNRSAKLKEALKMNIRTDQIVREAYEKASFSTNLATALLLLPLPPFASPRNTKLSTPPPPLHRPPIPPSRPPLLSPCRIRGKQ